MPTNSKPKKSRKKTSTTGQPKKKPAMPKHYKLRPDHERFAAEYVTNGNNASAAVKTVWPETDKHDDRYARVKARRLLTNDNIRQHILDLSANNGLTLNKCLNRLNQRIDTEDNQQIKAIQTWLDLAGYTDRRQQDSRDGASTINLIGNDALDRLRQVAEDRINRPGRSDSHVERRHTDNLGSGSTDAEIVNESPQNEPNRHSES